MSAFVVDKSHIDAMLTAALRYGGGRLRWSTPDGGSRELAPDPGASYSRFSRTSLMLDEIGAMLLAENIRSVEHRYSDAWETGMMPGDLYSYERTHRVPSPVETLKIVRCYEYQSCEHPEWPASEAKAFCDVLTAAATCALDGYDDAPWEWSANAMKEASDEPR